jgi:Clp amino terminal domain.
MKKVIVIFDMQHDYIGTEHLLLGLIQEAERSIENDKKPGVAARVLTAKGVVLSDLCEIVERILDEYKSGRRG